MKLGIIIQARLGSTRLAHKMVLPIVPGITLFQYQLEQLKRLDLPVIIASPDDDLHRQFHQELDLGHVQTFLGDESDVLKRFVDCAAAFSLTSVMRVCGDNPFLNLDFLNNLASDWSEDYDYASYFRGDGTPAIRTHYGLFTEIVKAGILANVNVRVQDKFFHEHVTNYFYEHAADYKIRRLPMPEPLLSGIPLRLTVDTADDLDHVRKIAAGVKDTQNWREIIAFSKQHGLLEKMEQNINSNAK
jgi:spore coat polysaccharide biosynthesis protein SpsF